MKNCRRLMMMVMLALGTLTFVGCSNKGMPQLSNPTGHDAEMGGGTGTGTIGDNPTVPSIDNP